MKFINTKEIKKLTEARKVIDELQMRLLNQEQVLDDLARATEIAQYTKQFECVEQFRENALKLLEDRITVPQDDDSEMKIRIYE